MSDLIIGRHYFKKNPEGDNSIWKPGAHLDPAKRSKLQDIRWNLGLMNERFGGVYSSGLVRADETAEDYSHCRTTPANELNPLAIYGDKAWREFCITADSKEMSPNETMGAFPVQTAAMGMLGANFLRRKVLEVADGETVLAITHQPLVEIIVTTLLGEPMQYVTKFSEGDLLKISFDGNGAIYGSHFMSAANALVPKGLPPSLDQ